MLSTLTHYINDNFTSKRGLISAIKHKSPYLFGFYKVHQHIDFNIVSRLIFVCSGNICRNPFAEYIAKDRDLDAISYGLHCRGGDKADPRAIHEASLRGVNMQNHITGNISEYKLKKSDLILVMKSQHLLLLNTLNMGYKQVTFAPLWS